jgi:hypothetical protein
VADLDENLRTFLLADATVAALTTSIHINRVPENKTNPYIWIQTTDTETELNLDGSTGPTLTTFSIEGTSTGTQSTAFIRVDSLDDSYISRQAMGDLDDYHICGLTCFIGTDSRS